MCIRDSRHHRCKPITADFNWADDLRLRPRMSCRNIVYGTVWWCYHSRGSIGHNVCTPWAQWTWPKITGSAEFIVLLFIFLFFYFFCCCCYAPLFSDRRSKGASSNGRTAANFQFQQCLWFFSCFIINPVNDERCSRQSILGRQSKRLWFLSGFSCRMNWMIVTESDRW